MTLPLIFYGDGDLKQADSDELRYMAFHAGKEVGLGNVNAVGALRTSKAADSDITVGTLTDTYLNQAVGTHGTTISTSSTSVTLYQKTGTAIETGSADKHLPIMWADDLTAIKEMNDSAELDALVDNLIGVLHDNEYPGTYRLSASNPDPGNWETLISDVYTDTRTDGTAIDYSIWRKINEDNEPSPVHPPLKLKRVGDDAEGAYQGVQQMDDAEIQFTLGRRMRTRIAKSGLGRYQLRSSSEGVPTDPGTWVSRGTATDTRNICCDIGYTPCYTACYATDYTTFTNYAGIVNYLTDYQAQELIGVQCSYSGTYQGPGYYLGNSFTGNNAYIDTGPSQHYFPPGACVTSGAVLVGYADGANNRIYGCAGIADLSPSQFYQYCIYTTDVNFDNYQIHFGFVGPGHCRFNECLSCGNDYWPDIGVYSAQFDIYDVMIHVNSVSCTFVGDGINCCYIGSGTFTGPTRTFVGQDGDCGYGGSYTGIDCIAVNCTYTATYATDVPYQALLTYTTDYLTDYSGADFIGCTVTSNTEAIDTYTLYVRKR